MTGEQLHERLEELRKGRAPLPLALEGQAAAQALRLRTHGLSYSTIAAVMGIYHGVWHGESAWRHRLRQLGAPPVERGYGLKQDRKTAP